MAVVFSPMPAEEFREEVSDALSGPLAAAVRWTNGRSMRQQPVLATMAWLAAFGGILRGFRTPTGLRSNLYMVGVAPSGSGKDSARKGIVRAFAAAGLRQHIGGETIRSEAGLIAAVVQQPSLLYLLDEFGHTLRGFCDPKAPRHVADIATTLTKLFTSSDSAYLGSDYADTKLRPRQPIEEPCVSIYGTATHEQFYSVLRASKIDDGTFSRFIIYDAGESIPRALTAGELDHDAPIPPVLVDALKRLAERAAGAGEFTGDAAVAPEGVVMRFERAAQWKLERLGGWADTAMPRAVPHARPMLARIEEVATKLALVHALACDPECTVIRDASAAFGEAVARNSLGTILSGAKRFAAESDRERQVKRVAEVIRDAGRNGIRQNALTRKTQWLSMRERTDILATLIEAGTIRAMEPPVAHGRPPAAFVHSDHAAAAGLVH